MPKFSANLGFLWNDRPLPEAIHAAASAGFDAVECHWPYDASIADVAAALKETGLPMLGVNTRRGNVGAGENGLAALPGRQAEAQAAIDEALEFASATGTANIHVMAGVAAGPKAHSAFITNLEYACEQAARTERTILIEPLNHYDAPGYFHATTDQAVSIIREVGAPNVKLMFDCYHVQLMEGDVTNRLKRLMPIIGHIQIASVPDRGAPDHGELNYSHIFQVIDDLGYFRPVGAEYKPGPDTDASLDWLKKFR